MVKISTVSTTLLMFCLQHIFMHTSASNITLLSHQSTIKAQIGEELDIICLASMCNTKDPGFTWSSLIDKTISGTVKTIGKTSILTIKVDFETGGSYRCTVSCDNPPPEKRFSILVYSFRTEPILHISSLVVGQQSHITCSLPSIFHEETLTVQILLAGKKLAEIGDEEISFTNKEEKNITLTYNVDLGEEIDKKEVKCVAILEFTDDSELITKSTTKTLTLMYPPEEPQIIVQPSKRVNAGEELHLLCSSNSKYEAVFQWVKQMGDKELEMSSDGHGTLTISNAEPEYSGVYICYAKNSAGRTSSSVTINVQGLPEKPTLSLKPATTVVAGEKVIIECLASNNTNVTLWKISDDGEISLDSAREFKIDAVEPIDAAVYKCISENQYGVSEMTETLTVEYPPRETILRSSSTEVNERQMVTLTCVSKGLPTPSISIYKVLELGEIVLLSSDTEVTLSDVTSGIYECQANNRLGSDKDNLEISVQVPPRNTVVVITPSPVVTEGDSVQILCSSEGSPNPTHVLMKITEDGPIRILSDNGSYNITHVRMENAGTYICESINNVGHAVARNTLTVQVPPRNTTVVVTPSQNIREGDTVTITCETHSIPSPTIILQKVCTKNNTVLQTNNGTFTLHNVTRNDTGTYMLQIINNAGNETEVIDIIVSDRQHSSPRFNPTSIFIFGSVAFVSAGVIASIVYHLKKSKLQGSYSLVKALRSKV